MPFQGVNNTLKRVSCNVTKWIAQWNAVVVAILAQIAVTVRCAAIPRSEDTTHTDIKRCLRIYAITDRNKLPAVVLSAMILAQVGLGINIVYANVKDEGKPPEPLLSWVTGSRTSSPSSTPNKP